MSAIRFKDLRNSLVSGPLRVLIPLLGYYFLYPAILQISGQEVLGLWALLAGVPALLGNFDVGISLLLKREFSRISGQAGIGEIKRDFRTAVRFYLSLFILLVPIAFAIVYSFVSSESYTRKGILISVSITVFSIGFQLIGRLYSAILAGAGHNYLGNYVAVILPVGIVLGSLSGAFLGCPLEGFALGYFCSSLLQIVLLKVWISRLVPHWNLDSPLAPDSGFTSAVAHLFRRGWHLYSGSLGIAIREPVLRFGTASVFGLEAVGIYDIAMRVSRTAREIVAAPFSALFTAFADYSRRKDGEGILAISRVSLGLLMAAGGVCLSALLILVKPLYDFWLGAYSELLVSLTIILVLWNALTLLNIPFWFLLQASGFEKEAARAVWIHSVSTIFLMVAAYFFDWTIVWVITVWVMLSLFTQVLIYWYVETRTTLFFKIVHDPWLCITCGCFLLLLCFGFTLSYWNGIANPASRLGISIYALSLVFTSAVGYRYLRQVIETSGKYGKERS